ncbi:LacI family transcriptional regulator [Kribbella amoyensis]|uniref:LacI family transcriptional regulator n=1 Tax=Kribbella amoyensis TaxID=996641 RepID=A0A561AZI9_9ACTN|nr:LacI family DNA-binding transcriptional regulator [Kribbella amoyensis]TWD72044.1 LacI family transcriptional regulator [Kribbella amoyensis]
MTQDSRAGAAPERRRPATMYEVARLAGVSHQTVSRYLRKEAVSAETSAKVAAAMEQLDYRPNLAARAMRTRRAHRIVVVLPESTAAMPVRMLKGAAAAAHEAGYLLDVVSLEGDATARAARIRTLLHPESVDAILSFTPLSEETGGVDLSAFAVPIVIDGEYDDNMRARGLLADATPAADIVKYLAGLGHRRFLHVAGPAAWTSARNRRTVYERTVAELGLESYGVVEGNWSIQSGWDAATQVLPGSGVTAVFAANDQAAFGVIRGLQEQGIDVPGEVSVFGWNGDEIGRYLDPALSTVEVDRALQGREAVRRLLALLQGEEPPVPPAASDLNRLVIRASTGPAPKN